MPHEAQNKPPQGGAAPVGRPFLPPEEHHLRALARRAILPEVLLVADVAAALGISAARAEEVLLRGELGDCAKVGGRPVITRAAFLAALQGGHDG